MIRIPPSGVNWTEWFAAEEARIRAEERTELLASLELHENGGCILNASGKCVVSKCVRR